MNAQRTRFDAWRGMVAALQVTHDNAAMPVPAHGRTPGRDRTLRCARKAVSSLEFDCSHIKCRTASIVSRIVDTPAAPALLKPTLEHNCRPALMR
ncbi:hypothetical protein L917_19933 [Phytophthora nicotianae]|uniref:Uncharacterized protein n=3 Tax=Phytophthora nicotianae TaxID=4792 RepID=V9E0F1_PHYNI|nr:hypothetical protein F443_20790 [Phytophthora nicotianae P1569]ETL79434.1 hypothetical protein L917_19936 [Phytophthora nicotianae]ETO61127.1 hypothetical protein F444_20807 [Phytophthora nicotianae P1976]ETI32401.1 hypothetical protein F443_20786 [Phytophthora nicotianae P1569]ETL79466.1 hypothetical protein L917_19933 [Phytophthora nicotianae]